MRKRDVQEWVSEASVGGCWKHLDVVIDVNSNASLVRMCCMLAAI